MDFFESSLEETLQGETSHGTTFAIKRADHVEALTNCHVVFISKSEKVRVDEVLRVLRSRPILTVSELEGFALRGGALNFFRDQGHIRFEVNREAAESQGLKLSSELLRLGKIVRTKPRRSNQ